MTTSIPTPTQKFPHKFNTLEILRGGWYVTWAVSFLLFVASIYTASSQRQALKTVGKDAAPSIITAQQLRDSFADIDASLANELLSKPGADLQAMADFEKNRKKIADRLLAASKNITFKEEEPIVQGLQRNSIEYFLKLQETRDTHKLGNPINTLNVYREAASIVDNKILPQAQKLDEVNTLHLKESYEREGLLNKGLIGLVLLLGLGQLVILVGIQLFLYRRMQRIFNKPLLGASAIATIFLGYAIFSFMSASSNLKIAKEDAFDSLHALRKMRSISYKANGDESRYLLDAANAGKHEIAFNNNIAQILKIPPSLSVAKIIQNANADRKSDGFTGLFADELNNITFDGEKKLAIESFKAFADYVAIDAQIRQLYRSGKLAEAIALCIGDKPGQSNWAFDNYKKVHTNLIDLNKLEFDRHIKIGEDGLAYFEIIAAGALGGVAILTLFGLRPRLMEYL
jgi:hypothetical protein